MPLLALLLQLAAPVVDGHTHPRGRLTVYAPEQCRTVRAQAAGADRSKPQRCRTERAIVPKPRIRPR